MEEIILRGAEMKFRVAREFVRTSKKYSVNGKEIEKDSEIVNAPDNTKITIHDEDSLLY